MKPGPNNLITDIDGLTVGQARDDALKSGVTALFCEPGNVASVHVAGGAPGTRETDLLQPENTVQSVDALVLSGGSAFGLDAASGVQAALREKNVGFAVGDQRIPVVPAAILFDLINGGDKSGPLNARYQELGYAAAQSPSIQFELGSQGAGTGALIGGPAPGLKGGLGSASTVLENGLTIAALVAVNAVGAATVGEDRHFWAAPFEIGREFGGCGPSPATSAESHSLRIKFRDTQNRKMNTTIGIIATDALLDKAQAKRLAMSAHDGLARAVWPAHTPLDGDLVFAVATGTRPVALNLDDEITLSAVAASTMSRAIARGIYLATPSENDLFPTWANVFAEN